MTKIEHDVVLFAQCATAASKSPQHPRTAHGGCAGATYEDNVDLCAPIVASALACHFTSLSSLNQIGKSKIHFILIKL